MQAACLTCSLVVLLAACAPAGPPALPSGGGAVANLTATEKSAIGQRIWQNECGGTVMGLTSWNGGEEFPSLGIGHFIWYPAGFRGRFEESWPQFIAFARQRGANPPAVALEADSPWQTKAAFLADFHSARMSGLRKWLADHVALQTDYIVSRSHAALRKIVAAAPASERTRIEANYRKVATTAQGNYALVDYVNFKGDGALPSERYNGYGWGLLQVLGEMKEVPAGPAAAREFSAAAKRVLSRRIANSPPARGEKRWEEGWHRRCDTYAHPL